MKNSILFIIISVFILTGAKATSAEGESLSFSPLTILQGDPVMIRVEGVDQAALIKKITFGGKALGVFMYQNKPTALLGIDLNKKVGTYEITAELTDGTILKKNIEVGKRDKEEQPLGIPEKLGGNTQKSADKLVATLAATKKNLSNIRTNSKSLWKENFTYPLKNIFITDPYGNSRSTGGYLIAHKGTDYRAKTGTEVYAINRGVIRIAQSYRDYGNTVFIDHGQGLMSSYLHLSKIKVKVGKVVERGQVIGLAGDTGYSLGSHLHLGIRINEIGIDPEKFFALFK